MDAQKQHDSKQVLLVIAAGHPNALSIVFARFLVTRVGLELAQESFGVRGAHASAKTKEYSTMHWNFNCSSRPFQPVEVL